MDLGRIAAAASTFGGSEAYRYLSKPGHLLGPNDVPPTAPADPNNAQYGAGNGSDLSNQLAALGVQGGLQQQDAQNQREGAFYNQANGNFDLANAAQMRGGPQIQGSAADQARQLAALGGTNANASTLTAMGTAPMGQSYAEAQLQQGLAAGQAQQLSMARSGRSLGSGQAAMAQAAFNNAGLSQQTNQAAASARIQEQNNYNQFQLGALGAANNAYGSAANQAGAIRSGNEGVQTQNANLNLQQQQVNNQTSSLYNGLGSSQQGLGMQANQLGLQANQFGQQQASNIMGAQLAANTSLNGANAQISMANNQQANASETAQKNATLGLVQSGIGAAGAASDERVKTNITPLDSAQNIPFAINPDAGELVPGVVTAAPGVDQSKFQTTTTIPDPAAPGKRYIDSINALNAHYAPSQRAPVDVLNRVPGAGAGPSASQAALLSHMNAQNPDFAPRQYTPFGSRDYARGPAAPIPTGPVHMGQPAPRMLHAPVTSDEHSKTRIRELETKLASLGADRAPPTASFAPQAPDTAALDAAYRNEGGQPRAPGVDFRNAHGYEYEYKDPNAPGAAPGRQVGTMAQELEQTSAAPVVHDTPFGKQVDTARLPLALAPAVGETQRRVDELERQLAALKGPEASDYTQAAPGTWFSPASPY
jgi:hypothetical protein